MTEVETRSQSMERWRRNCSDLLQGLPRGAVRGAWVGLLAMGTMNEFMASELDESIARHELGVSAEDAIRHASLGRQVVEHARQADQIDDSISVRCTSLGTVIEDGETYQLAGLAFPDDSAIVLDSNVCANYISGFEYMGHTDEPPIVQTILTDTQVQAQIIVNHELVHLANPALSEAEVHCHALQDTANFLSEQGYEDSSVNYMGKNIESFYDLAPKRYQSDGCQINGSLDQTQDVDSISDKFLPPTNYRKQDIAPVVV